MEEAEKEDNVRRVHTNKGCEKGGGWKYLRILPSRLGPYNKSTVVFSYFQRVGSLFNYLRS
jgi:hypothetical protein